MADTTATSRPNSSPDTETPDTAKAGDAKAAEASVDVFEDFRELLQEQSERQGRLRHVQQFLTSPVFFDLRDQPVTVSDPPEVIAERKRDLDYRIRVLESLVSILIEERDGLDRVQSASVTETVAEDQA